MKKLLFFLLLSSFAFGQLSQDSLQNIAKSHFEETYVAKTFKDPYSYELKKIWSEPITTEMNLIERITGSQSLIDKKLLPKKMHKEYIENIITMKTELQNLSNDEKNKVVAYDVYFDTYGANSYGNKILGKYMLRINNDGISMGSVSERKN